MKTYDNTELMKSIAKVDGWREEFTDVSNKSIDRANALVEELKLNLGAK